MTIRDGRMTREARTDKANQAAPGSEFLERIQQTQEPGRVTNAHIVSRLETPWIDLMGENRRRKGRRRRTIVDVPVKSPLVPRACTTSARTREAGHRTCPVRSQSVDAEGEQNNVT